MLHPLPPVPTVRYHPGNPFHLRRHAGERAVAHPGYVSSESPGELHRPVQGGGHLDRYPGGQRHHPGESTEMAHGMEARLFAKFLGLFLLNVQYCFAFDSPSTF